MSAVVRSILETRTSDCDTFCHCHNPPILGGRETNMSFTAPRENHETRVHKVYVCGYDFNQFASAVLPEYVTGSVPENGDESVFDILLVGMHGGCDRSVQSKFSGKVVYLNGESDIDFMSHGSYYLGPRSSFARFGVQEAQFYYVQLAALEIPVAFETFKLRPTTYPTKFLLYVSSRCLPHREDAFDLFSTIGNVTTGGKCQGTQVHVDRVEPGHESLSLNPAWYRAHKLYEDYKFGMVFENTNRAGYVTEKILNAFIGGTVPIYFGTTEVSLIFNTKAFIHYDVENPAETLTRVKFLMENPAEYSKVKEQPVLAPGAYENYFSLHSEEAGQVASMLRTFLEIEE